LLKTRTSKGDVSAIVLVSLRSEDSGSRRTVVKANLWLRVSTTAMFTAFVGSFVDSAPSELG
jgi:hypothetical protein